MISHFLFLVQQYTKTQTLWHHKGRFESFSVSLWNLLDLKKVDKEIGKSIRSRSEILFCGSSSEMYFNINKYNPYLDFDLHIIMYIVQWRYIRSLNYSIVFKMKKLSTNGCCDFILNLIYSVMCIIIIIYKPAKWAISVHNYCENNCL